MASVPKPAISDALINLIYQHLKDNGFDKAANVLKKHIPKVLLLFLTFTVFIIYSRMITLFLRSNISPDIINNIAATACHSASSCLFCLMKWCVIMLQGQEGVASTSLRDIYNKWTA